MARIHRDVICQTWNASDSGREASARLKAAGYSFMTPRRTTEWVNAIEAMDLMDRDDRKRFVRAWQSSCCLTEAWLRLRRTGNPWFSRLTPRLILEWGRCLRALGVPLKKMPRPPLHEYRPGP